MLAIYPAIVEPSHYTGEPNHVSDTEETQILEELEESEISEEFYNKLPIESTTIKNRIEL